MYLNHYYSSYNMVFVLQHFKNAVTLISEILVVPVLVLFVKGVIKLLLTT